MNDNNNIYITVLGKDERPFYRVFPDSGSALRNMLLSVSNGDFDESHIISYQYDPESQEFVVKSMLYSSVEDPDEVTSFPISIDDEI